MTIQMDPDVEEFLAHHGVKGMHWGVRNDRPEGVSSRTNRDAKKDAREFTKAKMFYGQGAGTRRKLIKAKVQTKSDRDPNYKKAFDHHVAKTDLGTRADQASRERKRKDITNSTRKGVRGTVNILNGNSQAASAATVMVVSGALYAHKAGIDRIVADAGVKAYKDVRNSYDHRKTKQMLNDLLKPHGFKA